MMASSEEIAAGADSKVEDEARRNATLEALQRDEDLAKVEIGTLTLILVVTIVGNVMVLVALYTKRKNSVKNAFPRMYFFIFHLCVADLMTAFLYVLSQLFWDITYRFKGNQFLCKAVKYGQLLGPYLSAYILMATAFDRYRAICYPLNYHTWSTRKSRSYVSYAWVLSLLFSIPQTYIFSYQEVAPDVWDCWATFIEPWGRKAYVLWYSISTFLVPLVCLIFTYACICKVIWSSAGTELGNRGQLISRAKVNTIKQTVAVIAVYIVCSLPFILVQLWASWDPNAFDGPWWNRIFTILVLLATLNSCANPYIFMIFNSDLRPTWRMLCGLCKQTPAPNAMKRKESSSESLNEIYFRRSKRTRASSKEFHDVVKMSNFAKADENGTTTTEVTTLMGSDSK